MEQFVARGEVTADGLLRLEVPCHLPPGPVEVNGVVRPAPAEGGEPDWRELYGLGREVWQGIDARDYLRELRQDRECPS